MRETNQNCPPGHICFLKTPQIFERHIANPRVHSPLYWRPTKTARWSTVVSLRHRKSWIALSLILETRHNYTRQACSFPGAIANPRARLPLMLEAHQNCPLGRLCFTETAQILECGFLSAGDPPKLPARGPYFPADIAKRFAHPA